MNNSQSVYLPAEWEKHEATLLSFPYSGKDWPGKYAAVKWAFIEIIRIVTRYEPVILIVKSPEIRMMVDSMLKKAHADRKQVNYIILDTNRSWMRDSGPVIVKNEKGERKALDFNFNGWAKYPDHRKDRAVPAAVASFLKIPLERVEYHGKPVVLEGGAIDHNGSGTLITTEECLLDQDIQTRNPGFEKNDYEEIFRNYLGITHTIWLGKGIEGDDTHGHVDDICRFVSQDTVLLARETDGRDKNHPILEKNLEKLQGSKLSNGGRINIVTIPMPGRIDFEDMRLPASYVNFMLVNSAVLVPVFNDRNDYKATGILQELFPDRDVIGVNAVDLVWGLGTLHCLSREIPESWKSEAGSLRRKREAGNFEK